MVTRLFETVPNFRDVGGAPATDGRSVVFGKLFRSEAIVAPTKSDATRLAGFGIRHVVDLRSETECDHAPNIWWRQNGVEPLRHDILSRMISSPWDDIAATPGVVGARTAMRTLYGALPFAAGATIAGLVRQIAGGGVPMLVHCTAGKDRTGFVIAILLQLIGVEPDAIVADYLQSAGRRTARATEITRLMVLDRIGANADPAAIDLLMGVEREYLEISFSIISRKFGSVENYALSNDVTSGEIEVLRDVMLTRN